MYDENRPIEIKYEFNAHRFEKNAQLGFSTANNCYASFNDKWGLHSVSEIKELCSIAKNYKDDDRDIFITYKANKDIS